MKKTVKKELIEKAEKLNSLVVQRRKLEKEEKLLKEFFKSYLDQDNAAQIGDYLISVDARSRTSLDKGLLSEFLGEKIHNFEKVTEYSQFNIKKVA